MYGYGYMDMDMDMDMDVDMDMDMDIDVYHRPNLELACNVGCRLFLFVFGGIKKVTNWFQKSKSWCNFVSGCTFQNGL